MDIEDKVASVEKASLPRLTEFELNSNVTAFYREQRDRQTLGAYQYELARQTEYGSLVRSLFTYKGNIGIVSRGGIRFAGSSQVFNDIVGKCAYVGHIYSSGHAGVIPKIMCEWLSNVVPEVIPRQAVTVKILRGLLIHRLMKLMLQKNIASDWKQIKGTGDEIAEKLGIDMPSKLCRDNFYQFFAEVKNNLKDADISVYLKMMMALTNNEPKKVGIFAAVITRLVMGCDFVKELRKVKSSVVGLICNNKLFLSSFIEQLLCFRENENLLHQVVPLTKHPGKMLFNPWYYDKVKFGVDINDKLGQICKLISHLTVAELSSLSVVPRILELEVRGACANVADVGLIPTMGSENFFKNLILGKKVGNDDYIFGHQEMKADMQFAFISQSETDFTILKSSDINVDIFELSREVPLDVQITEPFSTPGKILLLTFLLMLGTEELACENSDIENSKESEMDEFFKECCICVPVTVDDNVTPENAVGIKTLEVALRLYAKNDKLKLSAELLRQRGFRIEENCKSAAVHNSYLHLGYKDDELLKPRSGGNHVVGLTLKSRNEVIEAGEKKRQIDSKTKLSDADFVRFFYRQFVQLLEKYTKMFD